MSELTERQELIFKWLEAHEGFHGPLRIGRGVGLHPQENISTAIAGNSLRQLVKIGLVEKSGRGNYQVRPIKPYAGWV